MAGYAIRPEGGVHAGQGERRGATRERRGGGLAAAGLAVLCAACGDEPRRAGPGAWNVLVVSVDTLRADRLGCYGYERDTTPAIDAFAAEATVFRNAVAECSWTIPSHVTLLTGLYPTTHGVRTPGERLGAGVPTLAELLRARGYDTFAFTGGGWMSEARFGAGFERFLARKQRFARTLSMARAYLELREEEGGDARPFFGFLHTYDVHCPYEPAEPYASLYSSEGAEPFDASGKCGNPHFNAQPLSPGRARHLADLYDGSVRELDAALAPFFAWLAESGRLADTVVVLTSDHGEELFEHGRIGHEGTVFREVLSVPLIVRVPGQAPREVAAPVGLVDLVPTLADLLGLDLEAAVDGRSLAPLVRGEAAEGSPWRFSEVDWKGDLDSWLGPDVHVIVDRGAGTARAYDLGSDPLEREPRDAPPALRAALEGFVEALRAGARPVREGRPPAPEELERLRHLGY